MSKVSSFGFLRSWKATTKLTALLGRVKTKFNQWFKLNVSEISSYLNVSPYLIDCGCKSRLQSKETVSRLLRVNSDPPLSLTSGTLCCPNNRHDTVQLSNAFSQRERSFGLSCPRVREPVKSDMTPPPHLPSHTDRTPPVVIDYLANGICLHRFTMLDQVGLIYRIHLKKTNYEDNTSEWFYKVVKRSDYDKHFYILSLSLLFEEEKCVCHKAGRWVPSW